MTTDHRRRVYWDSVIFIHYLEKTPGKMEALRPIVDDAENDRIVIVASALTMVEVVKLKNLPLLDPQIEELIVDFFENDYIVLRNVDRWVAQKARAFIRSRGLRPADAIHVATALMSGAEALFTYDKQLLRRSGEIEGLRIEEP